MPDATNETCYNCGLITNVNQTRVLGDSNVVCVDCYENATENCSVCSVVFLAGSSQLTSLNNDAVVCRTCVNNSPSIFRCVNCNCQFTDNYLSERSSMCDDCSNQMDRDEEENSEDEDEDEDREYSSSSRNVQNHSFRVEKALEFKGVPRLNKSRLLYKTDPKILEDLVTKPTNTLFMGVELEVEVKDGDRNKAAHITEHLLKDFAMLKEDSSLSFGFEIVSAPATFEFHKSGAIEGIKNPTSVSPWEDFFEALKDKLKSLRSYDTSTCGMHIHMSRNAFTKMQIAKMNVFLNEPANKSFVTTIAARSEERWCKMMKKKHSDTYQISRDYNYSSYTSCPLCGDTEMFLSGPGFWLCSKDGCCQSEKVEPAVGSDGKPVFKLSVKGHKPKTEDRYQALNLINEHTIEFRIFKGTLKKSSFFKNIEFAHALAMFCGQSSIKSCDYQTFVKWVGNSGRQKYPYLAKFLEVKGYIPTVEPKVDKRPVVTVNNKTNTKKETNTNVFDNQ